MLPSRLKCDSCTHPTNMHTHTHACYSILACFCRRPLFSFAPPWSLDSSASVLSQASQPQGPTEWRGDGRKEEKQKDRRRERKDRTTSFAASFSSDGAAAAEGEERGGSGANLITSVLFMLLTRMWYQCTTTGPWQTAVSGKGHAAPPPSPLLHPQSFVRRFFSSHLNVFWPSQRLQGFCFLSIISVVSLSLSPSTYFLSPSYVTLVVVS